MVDILGAGGAAPPPVTTMRFASHSFAVIGGAALIQFSRNAVLQTPDPGEIEIGEPAIERRSEFIRRSTLAIKTGVGGTLLMEGALMTALSRVEFRIFTSCALVSSALYMAEDQQGTDIKRAYYHLQQGYAGPRNRREAEMLDFADMLGELPPYVQANVQHEGATGDLLRVLKYLHREITIQEVCGRPS